MEIRKRKVKNRLLVVGCWVLILTLLIQPAIAMTVNIRIEAPNKTIFSGDVDVPESVTVKDTGGISHTYTGMEINAIVAASNKNGFPFAVSNSMSGLSLDSIDNISNPSFAWWNQRINWTSAMFGISSQPIKNGDQILLHLNGTEINPYAWPADPPIKLEINKKYLKENENFIIKTSYFDESDSTFKPIKTTVNIGSTKVETNVDGNLTTSLPKGGVYEVFAEKTGYVRSQREQVVVGNVVTAEQSKASINKALNFLRKKQGYSGGIENASITAWAAIAFNAANIDPNKVKVTKGVSKKKQRSIVDYLKSYTKNVLNNNKKRNPKDVKPLSTDFARQIMAVVASKQNPRNFAGVDLVKGLRTYFNSEQFGEKGLINDDIFALIALRAANVSPKDKQYRKALSYVLSHQNTDGGFSYSASSTSYSENDTTSSAIQALVLAKRAGVKGVVSSINKAYKYLLTNQLADGGFHYNNVYVKSNVQSTAWATMAIISKNGATAPDALTTENGSTPGYFTVGLQRGNGGFAYDALGQSDAWTTTQVIPALAKRPWLSKK